MPTFQSHYNFASIFISRCSPLSKRLNIIALGTNLHFKPPPPQQYLQTKIMSSGSLIRSRVDFILSNGNHEISGQLNFSKKAESLIIIKCILPELKDIFLNLSHHEDKISFNKSSLCQMPR